MLKAGTIAEWLLGINKLVVSFAQFQHHAEKKRKRKRRRQRQVETQQEKEKRKTASGSSVQAGVTAERKVLWKHKKKAGGK